MAPEPSGQDVAARAGIGHAAEIALEHLHVGEQMVREVDRLRALEMGVAGNDDLAMALGEADERALHFAQACGEAVALGAQIEAEIERDLVIAAAGGVELGAGVADAAGELGLDVHVDVLELLAGTEIPRARSRRRFRAGRRRSARAPPR